MKTHHYIIVICAVCTLSSCTTVTGPNGQQKQMLTPLGSEIVSGLVGTGASTLTGAMLGNRVTGAGAGALTGAATSVVGGVTRGLLSSNTARAESQYNQPYQTPAPYVPVNTQYNRGSY